MVTVSPSTLTSSFTDVAEVDPGFDLPRGYYNDLLTGEQAVQNIAAGLPRNRHGLGPAHRGELVELLYPFHHHRPRRGTRRLLPE